MCIRKGTLSFDFVPVLCGSAFKNKGVQPLLDAVVDYLPSPIDISSIEGTKPGSDEETIMKFEDNILKIYFTHSLVYIFDAYLWLWQQRSTLSCGKYHFN